jgi:hypothetical protein
MRRLLNCMLFPFRAIFILCYSYLFLIKEIFFKNKKCYTCDAFLCSGNIYFDHWCDEDCSQAYMNSHYVYFYNYKFVPSGCLFVNHIERL